MLNPSTAIRTLPRLSGRAQVLLLAAALAAALVSVAAPVRAAGGDGLREAANDYRVPRGLGAVVGTALLDDIASHRAGQMARNNRMEHDLDYVGNRLKRSGVCWRGFGEIIAWERGYPDYSYARTMRLWWDSPTHHAIMMGQDYNAAGGAWATAADGGHYSVMVFVTLCGNAVASEPVIQLKLTRRFDPDRPTVFKPGSYTGYRLSSSGDVLARRTVTFRTVVRTVAAGQTRLNGRAWMKISDGPLAGYWVRQNANAYLRGVSQRAWYVPETQVVMKAGNYVGNTFDWLGGVTSSRRATYFQRVYVDASSRAIISGQPYFLVTSGNLAGYWVADTDHVNYR
jgi:cysteine-rich secretory family protein